ncbi:lytic polysaccharide monooxygenase [Arsenophonus sp.]|uniref:lytic polysaccharide monooxygenase n=1 Tax=Arsenophonus sp. TaxID=1872640 RepID=UPI00285653AB|nr:lytic polysaccharide monooxygenase [Arsenophonus sp.]MDR5617749.1 lytic polysaccharide monooxygenase [Arsenophonus sp.]
MKLKKFFIMSLILTVSSNLSAHGYIKSPGSRAYKCATGINEKCGDIKYEPQSVEQRTGFPDNENFPKDGKLASGGIARFSKLDEAGKDRWHKTEMQVGNNDFLWHLTARHSTANWRYYITKNGWNSSVPLERVSFDLEPFCSQYDHGAIPKPDVTMTCKVPEDRIGYHVIYGVRQIADTSNSFYQVVDVVFSDNDNKQPTEPVITEPTVTETNQPGEPVTTEPTVTATQPTKPVVSQPTETATTQPTVTKTSQPGEPVTTEPTVTATNQPTKPDVSQPTETATTQPTVTGTSQPGEPVTTEPTVTATQPTKPVISQPTETATTQPTVTGTNQPGEPVITEPTVTATSQPTKPVISQPTETATTQPTESVTTLNTGSNTALSTGSNTALSTGSNTTLNTGSNTALTTGSNTTLNTSLNTNLIVAPATATNAASTLDDNEIDILFHNSI